jgi:RNA polymerase sigma factor (TIGR02999 family)
VDPLLDRPAAGAADNRAALDAVFSELYPELSEVAHRQRLRWHGNHTLNTTVLLHEAYLKLVHRDGIRVSGRPQFIALAARAMRHILINYARDRRAAKRGGQHGDGWAVPESSALASLTLTPDQADELLALHTALEALAEIEPRRSQVVECRFFGGMTVEETAAAMGISPRTVKRDWAVAQAWLQRRMEQGREQPA